MAYVDGFVISVPKTKLKQYQSMARKANKVWKEYGAIECVETVGDDLRIKGMWSFLDMGKTKKNEVVLFSWIMYKTKAQRDSINKKVMADPRIAAMGDGMKFIDMKRMAMGGFKSIVKL